MGISGIIRYSAAAGVFAAAACFVWIIFRLLQLKCGRINLRMEALHFLAVAYLSALIQITALRIGLVFPDWLGGSIAFIPLRTTLLEASSGLWPLIYHIIGNMIWFVPFGIILPIYSEKWNGRRILLRAAMLSLMIECIQFILGTGISDIDDIILNALGALCGFYIYRLFILFKKSFNK